MRLGGGLGLAAAGAGLAAITALAVRAPAPRTGAAPPARPAVVVGTSFLACAVHDLAKGGVDVVRLVPPGSCPGHFDLRPADLERVSAARLVLVHGYQHALLEKLRPPLVEADRVEVVRETASPLVPEGYEDLLAAVARSTGVRLGVPLPVLGARLERRRRQIEGFARTLRSRAAGLRGVRVVSSVHLAPLCRWLGMEVAATLPRNGDVAPGSLLDAEAARPEVVVASLQEGLGAARTVAHRSGARLAVLSTFPGVRGFGEGYEDLLRHDVARLEAAWTGSDSSWTR